MCFFVLLVLVWQNVRLATVKHVDDVGTIHTNWQNGRTLGVTLEDKCSIFKEVVSNEEVVQDEDFDSGMELM